MSISDARRIIDLETTVAELRARVDALEARQRAETPPGRDRDPPTQRASSAPAPAADAVAIVLGKQGGDRRSEAVRGRPCTTRLKYGTAAHWLARLDRDRPDLAEKVLAGELSAHAAAITAGYRKRTITVPADNEAAGRPGGYGR